MKKIEKRKVGRPSKIDNDETSPIAVRLRDELIGDLSKLARRSGTSIDATVGVIVALAIPKKGR